MGKVYTLTTTQTNAAQDDATVLGTDSILAKDHAMMLGEGASVTMVDPASAAESFRLGQLAVSSGYQSVENILGTIEELAEQNAATFQSTTASNAETIAGAYAEANRTENDITKITPVLIAGLLVVGFAAWAMNRGGKRATG